MDSKIEKIGRVSAESVKKGTGKDWNQWVKCLDKEGARSWSHSQIVSQLKAKFKLTVWWQQGVAIGYETQVGLRGEGQNLKGKYTLTVTKTVPLSNLKLWELMVSKKGFESWLKPMATPRLKEGEAFEIEGGIYGEIRTFLKPKRMRISWVDSSTEEKSVVQLIWVPRKGEQCLLGISHEGLSSLKVKENLRKHWRKAVDDLMNLISSHSSSKK